MPIEATSAANYSGEGARMIGQRVIRPRQQVEDKIRKSILSGELPVGERLPSETVLAHQFDVSRTTIREALRVLSTQGLILKTPGAGGGSFVRSVDHNSLGEVIQESMHNLLLLGTLLHDEVAAVRQFLEVPSARLAAQHRTQEDMSGLFEIVERQRAIDIDHPEVSQLDAAFHAGIAKASKNRVLTSFVHALHRETEPLHYLHLSPEVGRETVRQHQQILKAIEVSDPDGAEKAIIVHLEYLREHVAPEDSSPTDLTRPKAPVNYK